MSNWEHYKELGNAEFKKKNYNAAISLYSDGIKEDPEQDVLYANRALCYKSLNNFRAALSDMDKALNINIKNVKNLKRKAELLTITGNVAEAINFYQRACNFEPREPSHYTDLNNAKTVLNNYNDFINFYEAQDYEKAEEKGKKIIEPCFGCRDIKTKYIECLISNNKLTEAAHLWSKLSDLEKTDDEYLYLICKIFYYEGNYDKAKAFLKKLLNKVNDNPKYNKLYTIVNNIEKQKESANLIFKAGKFEEAIKEYTKLLEIDPQNKVFNSTIIANRALCKLIIT